MSRKAWSRALCVAALAAAVAGCVSADAGSQYANEPVSQWPSQQALRSLHD